MKHIWSFFWTRIDQCIWTTILRKQPLCSRTIFKNNSAGFFSVKHSDFWAQKSIANNQDAMRAAKSRDGELIYLGQAPSLVPLTMVGEKAVLMFHSMGWCTTAQWPLKSLQKTNTYLKKGLKWAMILELALKTYKSKGMPFLYIERKKLGVIAFPLRWLLLRRKVNTTVYLQLMP